MPSAALVVALAVALAVALLGAAPALTAGLAAQETTRANALPQWEARVDHTTARVQAAHVGVGVNIRAGWYARVGGGLALGAAEGPNAAWRASQRADLSVRFLLDPFEEHPRGFYGGAGITARRDGGAPIDARLLLLFGAEGRPVRGVMPAVELALGGGFRVGVVLRRRRSSPAR